MGARPRPGSHESAEEQHDQYRRSSRTGGPDSVPSQVPAGEQGTGSGLLPLVVAALSMVFGVFATIWATGRGNYPFGLAPPDGDRLSVLSYVPVEYAAGLLAVLGCLGVPAALAFRRTDWSPSAYRPLLAFATIQAVVFGLLSPDVTVVMLAGYLLVLLGVPTFAVFLLVGAVRQPVTRYLVLGLVAILIVLQLTNGLFDWSAFRHLADEMATGPDKVGVKPLFVAGAFLLGTGWALLTVRGLRVARGRCRLCGRPGARWTTPGVGPPVGVLGDDRRGALPDALRAAADDLAAAATRSVSRRPSWTPSRASGCSASGWEWWR